MLIQSTLRRAAKIGRAVNRASDELAESLGLSEQVETFHKGTEKLPLVKQFKKALKSVAEDVLAPELPLYKEERGPCKVAKHTQAFRDEKRDRDIPVTVYYPENPEEKSSVVVLSHGLGGNRVTYQYLGKHLASHGYTVIQPTHEGSDTMAMLTRTPVFSFTQEELVERAQDISFCLDLVEQNRLPQTICQDADMEKVALAGHSFGALTTTVMAGAVSRDEQGEPLQLKDERIDAFIAMSPFGDALPNRILNMDPESYQQIQQPILYMNGEHDRIFTLGKGSKVHSVPYQRTGSKDKYQVIVGDAYHLSFAQAYGLVDPETTDMTRSTSVAFLDAHLHNQPEARAYLADELPVAARSRDSLAYT